MKDTIITGRRKQKELKILLICFAIAFLINIIAIIIYKTPWHEMFSQIGFVVVITLALYILLVIIRGIARLFKKKEKV